MQNSSDSYALFFGVIGGILPVLVTLIGVVQWLNTRFTSLDKRLSLLEQDVESIDEKITLATNGNKEKIDHARSRFFYELDGIRRDLGNDIADIKGYLAKEGGFILRASREKDI